MALEMLFSHQLFVQTTDTKYTCSLGKQYIQLSCLLNNMSTMVDSLTTWRSFSGAKQVLNHIQGLELDLAGL